MSFVKVFEVVQMIMFGHWCFLPCNAQSLAQTTPTKGQIKIKLSNSFTRKGGKAKKRPTWLVQFEIFMETQIIIKDNNQIHLAQFFLVDHTMDWRMTKKEAKLDLLMIFS